MYREIRKNSHHQSIITQYLEICNTKSAKNCGFIKSLAKLTKIFLNFSYFIVNNRENSKLRLKKTKCDLYVTPL